MHLSAYEKNKITRTATDLPVKLVGIFDTEPNISKNVMKHFYKKIVVITFMLCILCVVPFIPRVNAQTVPLQSLKITPIINDLPLHPGVKTIFPLSIQNLSGDPVGIHAEISGYDQIGEVPLYEQKPSAIINWTRLSKTDIIIPPHGSNTI